MNVIEMNDTEISDLLSNRQIKPTKSIKQKQIRRQNSNLKAQKLSVNRTLYVRSFRHEFR